MSAKVTGASPMPYELRSRVTRKDDQFLSPTPDQPSDSDISTSMSRSNSSGSSSTAISDTEVPSSITADPQQYHELHKSFSGKHASGHSTPDSEHALPSTKSLSTARKVLRAEHRRRKSYSKQQRQTTKESPQGKPHRRLFPTVDYENRVSHFDPNSDYRDFHGFYNLFWIGLAIMAITTILRNIKETGYPMRVQIWSLFTEKIGQLALVDFLMVATTSLSLPLHRWFRSAPATSFWTWYRGGMALQSIYQITWLAVWIMIPFAFDWTWTSQVFLLLHTMVMLMKMHSYSFYNGHLSEAEKRLHALDEPHTKASRAPAYIYPTPNTASTPTETPASVLPDAKTVARTLSRCSRSEVRRHSGDKQKRHSRDGLVHDHEARDKNPHAYSKAMSHESMEDEREVSESDTESVSDLREDLAYELTSPLGNVTYPANLTYTNYLDFLFCPTLCYELEYPRIEKIPWSDLAAKVAATFGCISLLTVTSEEFILPVLVDAGVRLQNIAPDASIVESLLILTEVTSWLLFPFMLTFLLVFLVIFEYVLGASACVTRFADRHFYSDWWNSTDWMEFSRKWNVPVHSFLRRHVYGASRPHTGRNAAMVLTFVVSAVGHEIVMACITKKLRGYGFICQMLQLPIVVIQRTKWVRGRKTMNNVMFWVSMILGLSLICSLYVLI